MQPTPGDPVEHMELWFSLQNILRPCPWPALKATVTYGLKHCREGEFVGKLRTNLLVFQPIDGYH